MSDKKPQLLGPIALGLFVNRLEAVCDEMGAVLQRAAFSPNIKDRLDFSCAVFDARGELCAQAAHIPVHLGSMAYAMADIVGGCEWRPGDMVVVNDPYLGGTHLPDVTVIAPVFGSNEQLLAFVANRAHHADIGAETPGSMPLSTRLEEEGVVIPPTVLVRAGKLDKALLNKWFGEGGHGDFVAQISANRAGITRLREVLVQIGESRFGDAVRELHDYAETLARRTLAEIPQGLYRYTDYMDDDGLGNSDIPIHVTIDNRGGRQLLVDFEGTAPQVAGNINCPLPVAAAAVFYVFRCLMPAEVPVCSGLFRPLQLRAPEGCLVNARRPAAVAAGNVETSQRITDAVLGALAQALPDRIPAASHGSMNNIAMGRAGADGWHYYETIGGGMGAGPGCPGSSGVQVHMTNTLNTPVESLEMHFPLRVTRYSLRRGSGGEGKFAGGDGLIREFQFLEDAHVTLLTERRRRAPWGLAGGEPARPGENHHNGEPLAGKVELAVKAGDRVSVASAGGGGWGSP